MLDCIPTKTHTPILRDKDNGKEPASNVFVECRWCGQDKTAIKKTDLTKQSVKDFLASKGI